MAGDRRRLRRRHGGELHADARSCDRGGAGRAQRGVRLLPDLQPGARRLQADGRHHARRTRACERHGVRVVRDMATAHRRREGSRCASRAAMRWPSTADRCRPGVDFMLGRAAGDGQRGRAGRVLHAWKAGPQTVALRRQLEAMPDGGVYVLSIPEAPYRCPPGPYERACQVARTSRRAKPRSKVLMLDANADVTSKGPLFKRAWAELYTGHHRVPAQQQGGGRRRARPRGEARVRRREGRRAERAAADEGRRHRRSRFITANKRWCEVDWLTFESKAAKGMHVLGDSLQIAPRDAQERPHGQRRTARCAPRRWSRC